MAVRPLARPLCAALLLLLSTALLVTAQTDNSTTEVPVGADNQTDVDNSTSTDSPSEEEDYYDLNLSIAGVFIILAASGLGIFGTISVGSNKQLKTNPTLLLVFHLLKFFGIGVIISTAWIHLITDSMEQFTSDKLPEGWQAYGPAYTGLFAMIAGFFFHGVEFYSINLHTRKTGHLHHGHSHGPDLSGIQDDEEGGQRRHSHDNRKSKKTNNASKTDIKAGTKSDLVPLQDMTSSASKDKKPTSEPQPTTATDGATNAPPADEDMSASSSIEDSTAVLNDAVIEHRRESIKRNEEIYDEVIGRHGHNDHEHGIIDDPVLAEEINADISLKIGTIMLEAGIIFHSVIIGLTLGVVQRSEWNTLVIAIAFHQFFEGMALGVRIAELKYGTLFKIFVLGLLYPLTTPVAIAIGIGVRQTLDQESPEAVIVQGIFDALSAGILMYTGYVEFLASEVNYSKTFSKHSRWRKLGCFLAMYLGAGAMAAVGIAA